MLSWDAITALTGSAVAIASVVTSHVRHEGRLNGHDLLFVEREKQVDASHDDLVNRLNRIESKLDAMKNR